MRLYHRTNFYFLRSIILLFLTTFAWGCTTTRPTQGLITVNIVLGDQTNQVKIASGSNVQEALSAAQINLNTLDRVEPPLYTLMMQDSSVKVTRVKEEYYSEQIIIPFEQQILRNEALSEGESRLSQAGVNGLEEVTHRRVFEDNVEVSDSLVKAVIVKEAIPEIVIVGSTATFSAVSIPGKIVYLSAGNAWIIENNTGDRRCVVATGDLDGRIFTLSNNGEYLLFTRFSQADETINSLWMALLMRNPVQVIDLGVENIIHFAEFDSSSTVVAYSTADWRETSPGWQANNDLYEVSVSPDGQLGIASVDLEANSGGLYGWWGMEFSWAPDQIQFLYTRPDGIGIISRDDGAQKPILTIAPYQTGGNWAWVPGAAWSPDGNVIYSVNHASDNGESPQEVQSFNLVAIPLMGGSPVDLVKNVGMFAYPEPSPMSLNSALIYDESGDIHNQHVFSVAYLQAIFPDQSETSEYSLYTIDRDGSNQKRLFLEEGTAGLDPQHVVWSPAKIGNGWDYAIAVIYNGNIWIIDAITGAAQQITGDGLTSRVDWR